MKKENVTVLPLTDKKIVNKSHLHKSTDYDSHKDGLSECFLSDPFHETSCLETLDIKYERELWEFHLWGDGVRAMQAPSLAVTCLIPARRGHRESGRGNRGEPDSS